MAYDYFNAASADPFAYGNPRTPAQVRTQPGPQTLGGKPVDPRTGRPPVNQSPTSWLDRLYGDYKTQYAEAKAANEERYQAGLGLLGGKNGNFNSADPYGLSGMGGSLAGPAMTGNTWGGASPAYAPQTAMVNQDAMRRGIFNTQKALNSSTVTNSLAAQNANLDLYDRQYRADMGNRDYANQLMNTRLRWLESPSDPYPDANAIYQLASTYGQGSQQGLDPSAFTGGFGGGGPVMAGAGNYGYNIPGGSFGYPTGGGYSGGYGGGAQNNGYGSLAAINTADKIRRKAAMYQDKVNSAKTMDLWKGNVKPQSTTLQWPW